MNSDDIRRALSPDDDWQAPTPAQLAAEFTATPYRIQPDAPRIGGMGAVYRALDTSDKDAQVAIKIIRPHLLGRDSFFERFQREETILRSLDHPNIVRLRDSGETPDGTRYIVMDWVEGRSLRHLTQPRSEENIHILLPIYRDLCAAVAHAHASGIFHRDLKPDNIIVTTANRAILLDLGIARPLQRDPANPTLTIPGESPGTLGYQPPEVWRDGQKPDHTADIYALGLILYELLMKRPADAASLRPSEKGMSADLDAIFRKAAAPEKKERYQSAAELLGAVEKSIAQPVTISIQQNEQPTYVIQHMNISPRLYEHFSRFEASLPSSDRVLAYAPCRFTDSEPPTTQIFVHLAVVTNRSLVLIECPIVPIPGISSKRIEYPLESYATHTLADCGWWDYLIGLGQRFALTVVFERRGKRIEVTTKTMAEHDAHNLERAMKVALANKGDVEKCVAELGVVVQKKSRSEVEPQVTAQPSAADMRASPYKFALVDFEHNELSSAYFRYPFGVETSCGSFTSLQDAKTLRTTILSYVKASAILKRGNLCGWLQLAKLGAYRILGVVPFTRQTMGPKLQAHREVISLAMSSSLAGLFTRALENAKQELPDCERLWNAAIALWRAEYLMGHRSAGIVNKEYADSIARAVGIDWYWLPAYEFATELVALLYLDSTAPMELLIELRKRQDPESANYSDEGLRREYSRRNQLAPVSRDATL